MMQTEKYTQKRSEIRKKILWLLRYRTLGADEAQLRYNLLHPMGTFLEEDVEAVIQQMTDENIITKEGHRYYKA